MPVTLLLVPVLLAQPMTETVARQDAASGQHAEFPDDGDDAAAPAGCIVESDLNIICPPGLEVPPGEVDTDLLEGRRRPGFEAALPERVTQDNPGAVRAPPPEAFPVDQLPIPDRWRLIQSLGLVKERWLDPYHQNTYKGDRPINRAKVPWLPIKGDDWFFVANLVSDTVFEPRTFPIPVGVQTTSRPGSLDVFGKDASYVFSQTFVAGAALIKGQTAFKPPDVEYRITLALNVNHVNV
ncbi:MAG: hypothetical protein N2423_03345, partial [Novosphingobium sp.]|nr:hypothetical protein [Novosphingobium sp.]